MSGLPSEISRALDDAVQALCQSRLHVVLVADASVASALPRLLAHELEGRAPVKLADLDARAHLGTIESVLAGFESSLVLLVPNALSLDPAVLRRLGELSSQPGSGLRVALFADRGRAEIRDPASELVQALGVGAEKIEIGGRVAAPAPEIPSPALALPPVVSSTARRPRPISVRSASRARQRARRRQLGDRSRWPIALLVVAASVGLLAGSLELVRVSPAPVRPVVAASPPPVSIREAPTRRPAPRPVVVAEIQTQPPPEPTPEPTPEPPAEPAAVEVASAPPETPPIVQIPISFNAYPWAEIEVDGVALGPTPIADWPAAPGRHQLRASFPNGAVVERNVQVDAFRNHFRIQ